MIITAVEPIARRRGRVEVRVDGVSSFDIARDVAAARDLKPGRAIERAEIDAIIAADRRRVALDAAVAMLARRPYSEREVRQRLARRTCEPAVIDETVAKLRTARLLDDAEYARAFTEARDRFSPRGQRLIARELRANGVAAELAQAAAAEVSDEDAAYRVASKRLLPLAALDYQAFRNRLGAFLQRRGFGWDACRTTVDRCWRELHDVIPDGEA